MRSLYLVVRPEGSKEDSFVVSMNSVDEIRHLLEPGTAIYLLARLPSPSVPPGVIVTVKELGRWWPPGEPVEVIGGTLEQLRKEQIEKGGRR